MPAAKFIAAIVGALAMAAVSVLTDGHITAVEWVQIAIAGATAVGVWIAANVPSMPAAKTAVVVTLAVLNGLVAFIADGALSPAEVANLVVAALTAAGVYAIANRPAPAA